MYVRGTHFQRRIKLGPAGVQNLHQDGLLRVSRVYPAGSKTKVQRSTPNSDGTNRFVSIGMVDDNIHKGKGSRSV